MPSGISGGCCRDGWSASGGGLATVLLSRAGVGAWLCIVGFLDETWLPFLFMWNYNALARGEVRLMWFPFLSYRP